MSLMPAFIIDDLRLRDHGYRVTAFGPYYQAFPDGRSITIFGDDPKRTHASVSQFSTKDADTLPAWEAWLHGVTDVVGPLLHRVPPNLGFARVRRSARSRRRPHGRCVAWAAAVSPTSRGCSR